MKIPSPYEWLKGKWEESGRMDDQIMRERNYEPISPGELANMAREDMNRAFYSGDSRDVFGDSEQPTRWGNNQ